MAKKNEENLLCLLIGQLSFVFSFAIISLKKLFGKTGVYLESALLDPWKLHTNLSTTHVNIFGGARTLHRELALSVIWSHATNREQNLFPPLQISPF